MVAMVAMVVVQVVQVVPLLWLLMRACRWFREGCLCGTMIEAFGAGHATMMCFVLMCADDVMCLCVVLVMFRCSGWHAGCSCGSWD